MGILESGMPILITLLFAFCCVSYVVFTPETDAWLRKEYGGKTKPKINVEVELLNPNHELFPDYFGCKITMTLMNSASSRPFSFTLNSDTKYFGLGKSFSVEHDSDLFDPKKRSHVIESPKCLFPGFFTAFDLLSELPHDLTIEILDEVVDIQSTKGFYKNGQIAIPFDFSVFGDAIYGHCEDELTPVPYGPSQCGKSCDQSTFASWCSGTPVFPFVSAYSGTAVTLEFSNVIDATYFCRDPVENCMCRGAHLPDVFGMKCLNPTNSTSLKEGRIPFGTTQKHLVGCELQVGPTEESQFKNPVIKFFARFDDLNRDREDYHKRQGWNDTWNRYHNLIDDDPYFPMVFRIQCFDPSNKTLQVCTEEQIDYSSESLRLMGVRSNHGRFIRSPIPNIDRKSKMTPEKMRYYFIDYLEMQIALRDSRRARAGRIQTGEPKDVLPLLIRAQPKMSSTSSSGFLWTWLKWIVLLVILLAALFLSRCSPGDVVPGFVILFAAFLLCGHRQYYTVTVTVVVVAALFLCRFRLYDTVTVIVVVIAAPFLCSYHLHDTITVIVLVTAVLFLSRYRLYDIVTVIDFVDEKKGKEGDSKVEVKEEETEVKKEK